MAVRTIVRLGTPQLRERSEEITDFSRENLESLRDDLKHSQEHYGGVGIAGPQVGIQKRVVYFGFTECKRYPNRTPIEETFLINPGYEALSDELTYDWEGCLSVSELRGVVARFKHIRYWGQDIDGNTISREVDGFHARLIQHELDHLDGIVFVDRLVDMKLFGFESALNYSLLDQYLKEQGINQ